MSLVKQLVTWRKAWTRRLVLTAPSNEPWSPYQILTAPPRWFHKPPHTSTAQVNMRISCESQVLLICGISCSTSGPQVTVSKGSHQQPGSQTCYRVEYFSFFTFFRWKCNRFKMLMYLHIWTYMNIYEPIQTYMNIYEHIWKYMNINEHINKRARRNIKQM